MVQYVQIMNNKTKSMLDFRSLEKIEQNLEIRDTNNRSLMYHLTHTDV